MVTSVDYPIHLGLAYLFLGGYVASRIFRALNLPGAVGIIVNGFIFSHFIQLDLLQGRDHLQSLAFFLVLLTAGFEISMDELRLVTFVFAIFPVTLEFLGIAAYAVNMLQYTVVEGLVLGITLCCLGDGLVIPKMVEFKECEDFKDLRLPRLVFNWAPLEASYILTLFGVIQGLAEPAEQETSSLSGLVMTNILRLVATVFFGRCLGYVAARVITKERDHWTLPRAKDVLAKMPLHGYLPMEPQETLLESGCTYGLGDSSEELLFVGREGRMGAVEAYLLILSVALLGFGLGASEGMTIVPMPFSSGSLFQPELLVIVIGACFAFFAERFDEEVAEELLEEHLEELKMEQQKQLEELTAEFEKKIRQAPSKKQEFEETCREEVRQLKDEMDYEQAEVKATSHNPATVEGVMAVVGGVWIFGQLVLFSMLGSKTDVTVFQQVFAVLPIMLVGQCCRLLGVLIATYSTINFRVCDDGGSKLDCKCKANNQQTWRSDALFCFLSTLPRATIQGALGPIPVRDRFFHSDQFRAERTQFIAAAARLYVVVMAVVGSILLDRYGVRALQTITEVVGSSGGCQKSKAEETLNWRRLSMARPSMAFQSEAKGWKAVCPAVACPCPCWEAMEEVKTEATTEMQLPAGPAGDASAPCAAPGSAPSAPSGSGGSGTRRGTIKQNPTMEEDEDDDEEEEGDEAELDGRFSASSLRRGTLKQPEDRTDESLEQIEPIDSTSEQAGNDQAEPTKTLEEAENKVLETTETLEESPRSQPRERGATSDSTPRKDGRNRTVTFGSEEHQELKDIAAKVEETACAEPSAPSNGRPSMAHRPTFRRSSAAGSSGRPSNAPRKMSLWDLEGKQKRSQKHSNASTLSNTTVETEPEEEVYEGGMKWSLAEIRPELRGQLGAAGRRRR